MVSGLPSLPVGRVRYHSLVSISSAGNFDAVRPAPASAGTAAAVAGAAVAPRRSSRHRSRRTSCSSARRLPSSFALRTVSASALRVEHRRLRRGRLVVRRGVVRGVLGRRVASVDASFAVASSCARRVVVLAVRGQTDRRQLVVDGVVRRREPVDRDGCAGHGQRAADHGRDGDAPAHRGRTGRPVRTLAQQRVPGGPLREGVAHVTASGERMPSHVPAFRSHGPVGRPASGFAGRVGSPAVRFRDRPVLASEENLAGGSRSVACVPARWEFHAASGGTQGARRVGRRGVGRRTVGRRRPDVSPAAAPGRCSSAARGRRHPAAARPS